MSAVVTSILTTTAAASMARQQPTKPAAEQADATRTAAGALAEVQGIVSNVLGRAVEPDQPFMEVGPPLFPQS